MFLFFFFLSGFLLDPNRFSPHLGVPANICGGEREHGENSFERRRRESY